MNEEDEPTKRAMELFWKVSNLRRFRNKHEEQFNALTEREVEVLTLVANGLHNPAIAQRLDIARTTVQNHRAGIRQKLSIDSQADYIKFALAFGLVSF